MNTVDEAVVPGTLSLLRDRPTIVAEGLQIEAYTRVYPVPIVLVVVARMRVDAAPVRCTALEVVATPITTGDPLMPLNDCEGVRCSDIHAKKRNTTTAMLLINCVCVMSYIR